MKLYFVLLMKSHLQSYPCPLQINSFWNLGLLLGITIILQIFSVVHRIQPNIKENAEGISVS